MVTTPTEREATIGISGSAAPLESLAERARNADSGALELLLTRVRPLVLRWAVVRTGDADDAEDVTQRVLMSVQQRIGRFDGRAKFTSWLYRVTANAAAEQRRGMGGFERLRGRLRALPSAPYATDPLEHIERERGRRLLRAMMEELTVNQRVALDLVDLQGYSPAEAAELIGMHAGTLRVHLLRARRAIRARILDEHGTMHDGK